MRIVKEVMPIDARGLSVCGCFGAAVSYGLVLLVLDSC